MIEEKHIEAILFAASRPIELETFIDILDCSLEEVLESLTYYEKSLIENDRGLRLKKIANTYELVTNADSEPYIAKIREKKEILSKPMLETLAIIAYKQPVTKAEIEQLRGVNSDRLIKQLQEKELICDMGRKKCIGRPVLYGTTVNFLRSMGINHIDELKMES